MCKISSKQKSSFQMIIKTKVSKFTLHDGIALNTHQFDDIIDEWFQNSIHGILPDQFAFDNSNKLDAT